jgi:hypothetical protein
MKGGEHMETDLPKKCQQYPGYYEIPGYSKFAINRKGEVIRKSSGKLVPFHYEHLGYAVFSISEQKDPDVSDDVKTHPYRHRLLCLVFKPIPSVKGMHVNHINGKRGDDRLENLEWCTSRENTYHAAWLGITPKCVPVLAYNVNTGERRVFGSGIECGRYFGIGRDSMRYRLVLATKQHPINGWVFKRLRDGENGRTCNVDIPIAAPEDVPGRVRPVQIKHLITGETFALDSVTDLSSVLGIPLSTICCQMEKHHQPVFPGFWLVKYRNDPGGFRNTLDPYLEVAKHAGWKAVQAENKTTGEVRKYVSTKRCADDHHLFITRLNYYLKYKHGETTSTGWAYSYIT